MPWFFPCSIGAVADGWGKQKLIADFGLGWTNSIIYPKYSDKIESSPSPNTKKTKSDASSFLCLIQRLAYLDGKALCGEWFWDETDAVLEHAMLGHHVGRIS